MRMRSLVGRSIFTGVFILTRCHGNGKNVTGEDVDEVFHRTKIIKKRSVDSGQWSVFTKKNQKKGQPSVKMFLSLLSDH